MASSPAVVYRPGVPEPNNPLPYVFGVNRLVDPAGVYAVKSKHTKRVSSKAMCV